MKIYPIKIASLVLLVVAILPLLPGTTNLAIAKSITVAVQLQAAVAHTFPKPRAVPRQSTPKWMNLSQTSVFVEQSPVIAADGAAYDSFGSAVALDGDTLIVGAGTVSVGDNSRPGAVDVFTRSNDSWSRQQRLSAADGADGDGFGFRVALDGDTAVVGAYFAGVDGKPQQGAAYIFVRTGTTWQQQQKLVAADGAAGDQFGQSLAIAGDTVVIGAATSNIQGAAYVFVRNGTTWSQQQKLVAADGAVNDQFGHAVALVGDTAIIGAPFGPNNPGLGAAYVFVRSGTTWSQQQKLVAADGATRDNFGDAVALADDTALIGAPGTPGNQNPVQGAAYLFVQSGTTWSQQQKLIAANDAEDGLFGWSVALDGDTAVICSWITDNPWHGSAYLFVKSGDSWSRQQQLLAAESTEYDLFGNAVALDGDIALFGAAYATVGDNAEQGRVYVFERQLLGNELYLPLIAR